MESKPFYTSVGFWLNLATIIFGVANYLLEHQGLLPLLGVPSTMVATIIGAANAFVNIYRRFLKPQAPLTLLPKL